MLQKAIPVLPAANIRDTIDFYERKLGFTGTNYGNYAVLNYADVEIHICMSGQKKITENPACYFFVQNIEDLYARLSAKELIHPKGQLTDRPWGVKEFTVVDNNGNSLRFGEKK